MIIFVDPSTEAITYCSPTYTNINGVIGHYTAQRATRDLSLRGLDPSALLLWETQDFSVAESLASVPHDKLVATIQSGVVTDVTLAPPPPTLYAHVNLTGGIQSPAGTLYLKNDGVDPLQVHAELREGPEVSSNAVTQLGGQDINGMWALELVNVDTGAVADTPLVQMSAGIIDVNYTTTIAPCEVELAEDRLQPIGDYHLKLAHPVLFKVVRALS